MSIDTAQNEFPLSSYSSQTSEDKEQSFGNHIDGNFDDIINTAMINAENGLHNIAQLENCRLLFIYFFGFR